MSLEEDRWWYVCEGKIVYLDDPSPSPFVSADEIYRQYMRSYDAEYEERLNKWIHGEWPEPDER